MHNKKQEALTGSHNKRLDHIDLRNNQNTAAIVDVHKINKHIKNTSVSEADVIHAKEWVDNGSRL